MAARLVGNPDQQFFKNDGSINASGTLTFYEPGTTTPKTIYTSTDTGGSTHTNPHTLDSAGRPTAPIFTDGLYDILVKDSAGSTLVSVSNYGDNNSAVATDLSNLVLNSSFETDTDSDGTPDNWTLTPHDNITVARSTSSPGHGAACLLFTVTGAGTATALSSLFEVSNLQTLKGSMLVNTSSAALTVTASVSLYDNTQSLLSTQQLFTSSSNSTSWDEDSFASLLVGDHETTARYAALKLTVSDNSTTGTVCFDGVTFYSETSSSSNSSVAPQGLLVSLDTDTSHDLNITAGSATATDGAYDLVLETEITKQIDAAWAAGDDAGGAETGFSIPTSGIIYIWLIGSSTTGAVDVLYSNSATSPATPTGYDKKRRILSWPTDASQNLLGAIHDGLDGVYLTQRIADLVDSTLTTDAEETGTFLCPALGLYIFSCQVNTSTAGTSFFVGTMQTAAGAGEYYYFMGVEGTNLDEQAGFAYERVDASSQMRYVASFDGGAGHNLTFFGKGYRDLGRNII